MKAETVLELLEATAEQLAVKVSYEPLGTAIGNGGLCKVKGEFRIIVDKRATTDERIATVAAALSTFDTTELAIPAKVREVIRQHEGSGKHRRRAA